MKPGLLELLILALVIVTVFGYRRLPQAGRSLGRGVREFVSGVTGRDEHEELPPPRDDAPST